MISRWGARKTLWCSCARVHVRVRVCAPVRVHGRMRLCAYVRVHVSRLVYVCIGMCVSVEFQKRCSQDFAVLSESVCVCARARWRVLRQVCVCACVCVCMCVDFEKRCAEKSVALLCVCAWCVFVSVSVCLSDCLSVCALHCACLSVCPLVWQPAGSVCVCVCVHVHMCTFFCCVCVHVYFLLYVESSQTSC